MADVLHFLVKINLAMGAAILIVFLLRRPVRAAFHAAIAYALWLLVPAMALAAFLPQQAISIAPPAMPPVVTAAKAELLTQGAAVMQRLPAPQDVPHVGSWVVLAIWLAGAGAMALYLLWLQHGFHRAERAGLAGPAVAGFIRPRIVVPADFASRFSPSEQAAILAHEQAHLARQDARVNAAAALLRCLCWFNPLLHLAALWLRRDQELACDAAALCSVPRRDYANTLLKAQMKVAATPLGCAWPGSDHPLTERIALLKRPAPQGLRRWGGIAAIALLTLSGGAAAWAQQEQAPNIEPTNRKAVFYMYDNPVFYLVVEVNEILPITDNTVGYSGPVTMQFPFGSAEAASARLSGFIEAPPVGRIDNPVVTLTDVELKYGDRTLSGKTLTFDPHTEMLSLDGVQMPSGIPLNQPSGTIENIVARSGGGYWLHTPAAAQQETAPASERTKLGMTDQRKLQMARDRHVVVSPAEVDTRIADLTANHMLPALPAGTDLRSFIVAQIAWEKTAH